jgi:archaeal flagellin FlaB
MSKLLNKIYKGKKGITGLETAIILIAFVTVAAVLAYTVLSAGIFSSERGKEAVYGGLNSAQSTMTVKGSVLGEDFDSTTPTLSFTLATALSGSSIDLNSLSFNYFDKNVLHSGNTAVGTIVFSKNGVTLDGTAGKEKTLTGNDQVLVTVDLAAITQLAPYDLFTLEIVPPTGATITVQRTLPGNIADLISLN